MSVTSGLIVNPLLFSIVERLFIFQDHYPSPSVRIE